MLRICAVSLCLILPAVLAQGPVAATGAAGLNYGNTQSGSEQHDKKNFGLNFSSDKGSSNQFSNTGLQAGAAGGIAQGYPGYYPQQPIYPTSPIRPVYPPIGGGYPYPGVGYPLVGGYPVVGSGSQVQVPGVNAGAGAVSGPGLIRY